MLTLAGARSTFAPRVDLSVVAPADDASVIDIPCAVDRPHVLTRSSDHADGALGNPSGTLEVAIVAPRATSLRRVWLVVLAALNALIEQFRPPSSMHCGEPLMDMKGVMRTQRDDLQVLQPIVISDLVAMMDVFALEQRPPQPLLDNPAMLCYSAPPWKQQPDIALTGELAMHHG